MSEIIPKYVDGEPVCDICDESLYQYENKQTLEMELHCPCEHERSHEVVRELRQQRDQAIAERDEARRLLCQMDAACKLDGPKRGQEWLDRYSYKGNTYQEQIDLAKEYAEEHGWDCFKEQGDE